MLSLIKSSFKNSAQWSWSSSKNFLSPREWNNLQTVNDSNSVKFYTTFVGKHTTYLTLMERVNTLIMILPNENNTTPSI